ncbi:MAG: sigma-70 family RNA polymerase sigma factor [Planctomycetaceae bacterium]|nr:sigma-70 family RNA polymerase sigma factor [Planctomycetaceae bacterium]
MGTLGPDAVTQLWREQSRALTLYARQWCDAPEDIVQEAFLTLVRQPSAPDNPLGWIYRVVRNRAQNAGRARRRRQSRETAAAQRRPSWFEPGHDDRLDADAASEALQQLPDDQREAIVARIWGGLGFDEIARLTDASTSTVYRNYRRGLRVLQERLGWKCETSNNKTSR